MISSPAAWTLRLFMVMAKYCHFWYSRITLATLNTATLPVGPAALGAGAAGVWARESPAR